MSGAPAPTTYSRSARCCDISRRNYEAGTEGGVGAASPITAASTPTKASMPPWGTRRKRTIRIPRNPRSTDRSVASPSVRRPGSPAVEKRPPEACGQPSLGPYDRTAAVIAQRVHARDETNKGGIARRRKGVRDTHPLREGAAVAFGARGLDAALLGKGRLRNWSGSQPLYHERPRPGTCFPSA